MSISSISLVVVVICVVSAFPDSIVVLTTPTVVVTPDSSDAVDHLEVLKQPTAELNAANMEMANSVRRLAEVTGAVSKAQNELVAISSELQSAEDDILAKSTDVIAAITASEVAVLHVGKKTVALELCIKNVDESLRVKFIKIDQLTSTLNDQSASLDDLLLGTLELNEASVACSIAHEEMKKALDEHDDARSAMAVMKAVLHAAVEAHSAVSTLIRRKDAHLAIADRAAANHAQNLKMEIAGVTSTARKLDRQRVRLDRAMRSLRESRLAANERATFFHQTWTTATPLVKTNLRIMANEIKSDAAAELKMYNALWANACAAQEINHVQQLRVVPKRRVQVSFRSKWTVFWRR